MTQLVTQMPEGAAYRILEAVAGSHLALCRAPRGAAAVVDPDGTVVASWGLDASPRTVFRIASMTKSFTAALVLLLRDEGTLSLDEPIAAIAPELDVVVGPGIDPAPITVRHLLTMSSGLATDDPWADRHLDATDTDLDAWMRGGLRFAYPTATEFEYSNLGYALIGRVVHRVTGQRVQSLITERLLQPLGMTSTVWSLDQLAAGTDVTEGMHPVGEGLVVEPPLADGVIAPMGGLWSCTADLCTWMAIFASAFSPNPISAPLAVRSRREMQQLHRGNPIRRLMANDGSIRIAEGGYAMGLTTYLDDRLGRVVTHSGGLPGYGSNMRWVPNGTGVVVLANVTYAPMWHAAAAVLDALGVAGLATAQRRSPQASRDLTELSERLVAWLTGAEVSTDELFADNVLADQAARLRQAHAQTRLGRTVDAPHGAVRIISVEPDGEAQATVTFITDAVHRLVLSLAPVAPPLIQSYQWTESS